MTPVALPQHRAGAGPNKSSSSQFLELTYNDMHNTVPLRQVVPLSPVYTQ